MEKAISSDTFGMSFWLDVDNEFCYCPEFNNNTLDKDNWGYVSEWTDFEGIDFNQLLRIHRELVIRRVHQLSEVS
tara:strand:- start:20 stop:244 length:225 start_codon:yes stop_codon:yes gene_type:complete